MAEKRKRGRPTLYTDEKVEEIVRRISEGETLRAICREDHMPNFSVVYDWLEARPEFSRRFARARELGADAIASEALQIADTPLEGTREEDTPGGLKVIREDMLGHRRLQVETRLKLLAKWFPQRYGDRVDLTHSSPDGGPVRLMNVMFGAEPDAGEK